MFFKKISLPWSVEPVAAMKKDLTVMFILAHSVQSSLDAFFLPAPHPDSDSAGGRKAT
jgi:hypothetical protein